MTLISMTELKNDLRKYTETAQTEDVIITKNGKPYVKITAYGNSRMDALRRLAGSIRLDKTYEEIMDEKYEEMLKGETRSL